MNWISTHFARYAALDFSVVPIKSKSYGTDAHDSKMSFISWKAHQEKRATEDQVRDWAQRWPAAGVGIVCGRISNIVVIDDDRIARKPATTAEDQKLYDAADAFINAIDQVETAVSRTARGKHYYFRPPLDADRAPMMVPTNAAFLPGLDTRGEGGYVLAPPSIHFTGVSYIWEHVPEDGIADLPMWAYETITRTHGIVKYEEVLGQRQYSLGMFSKPVQEGGRNNAAAQQVGVILQRYRELKPEDIDTAWNALMGWNIAYCNPVIDKDELLTTFNSIFKAELAKRAGKFVEEPFEPEYVTGAQLAGKTMRAPTYAIKGFILEGVTQLFGKPKAGKSFLAMQMGTAVALGRPLFPRDIRMYAAANHPGGFDSKQGDVLYLALEDSERRLRDRLESLLGSFADFPANLTFATRWSPLFDGGLARIDEWIASHPKAQLVIIDPLAAFVGDHQGKGNVFRAEYRMFRPIWELSQKWKIPIVIVDHASKSKGRMGSTDPFDSGSGTLGGQAAVDTIMIMEHDDKTPSATVHYKGRDIERGFISLEHDRAHPAWRLAPPKPDNDGLTKAERKAKMVADLA